jgi:hypothetical protein
MFCPFIPSRNSVLSFHSRCSVFPPGVLPFLTLRVFCPSFPRRSSDFPSLEVFCHVLSKIGSALSSPLWFCLFLPRRYSVLAFPTYVLPILSCRCYVLSPLKVFCPFLLTYTTVYKCFNKNLHGSSTLFSTSHRVLLISYSLPYQPLPNPMSL